MPASSFGDKYNMSTYLHQKYAAHFTSDMNHSTHQPTYSIKGDFLDSPTTKPFTSV